MHIFLISIFLPHGKIRYNIHSPDTVKCYHIELPHGFIILRRISCGNNQPAFRYPMCPECFCLKKLKHGRRKGFRYTVNLINKQNPFFKPCNFHLIINGSYNLAHRIFRNGIFLLPIISLFNPRKTHGALPGVMGDRIGYQPDFTLFGHLLHNLRLPDTRRPDKQDGTLPDYRNLIVPISILPQIGFDCIF